MTQWTDKHYDFNYTLTEKDIEAGIWDKDVLYRSVERLPLYNLLNTQKIDVSDLSIEETSEKIMKL